MTKVRLPGPYDVPACWCGAPMNRGIAGDYPYVCATSALHPQAIVYRGCQREHTSWQHNAKPFEYGSVCAACWDYGFVPSASGLTDVRCECNAARVESAYDRYPKLDEIVSDFLGEPRA